MRKVTLIRGARQLLTLRGPSGPRRGADLRNLGIIQDGAVLIADGLIVEVGPSRRVENLALARGAEEIDASGCVVMPGFVDSHVHCAERNYSRAVAARAEDARAPRGGRSGAARDHCYGGGGSGGEDPARARGAARTSVDFCVDVCRRRSSRRSWPNGCCRPCGGASWRNLRRVDCEDARNFGQGAPTRIGGEVARRAAQDAISTAVQVDARVISNVVEATERDAILLARSQTIATLSPAVAFDRGAERHPPARMLIDNGAAVALASGGHSPNMQMTVALACQAMNMTAAEAIAASTINGAHAMGRARKRRVHRSRQKRGPDHSGRAGLSGVAVSFWSEPGEPGDDPRGRAGGKV